MENLEKVEKIREKTGVSYEDAKGALEACNYDILDAIVYLEKLGKIQAPKQESFTTANLPSTEFVAAQKNYEESCQKTSIGDELGKFFKWCGKLIKKGCETSFEVTRHGKNILSVPVIVLVIAVVFAFWITIPLLVIGLFCSCKYYFRGINSTTVDLNGVCEKASETCENIKNDFQSAKEEKNDDEK